MHADNLFVSVIGGKAQLYPVRSSVMARDFDRGSVEPYIMQLAVTNLGRWLVAPGKHHIYVFDTSTGLPVHKLAFRSSSPGLPLNKSSRIQAISVPIELSFQTNYH